MAKTETVEKKKFVPKVVRNVILPTLKLVSGVPHYVKFDSAIIAKPSKEKVDGEWIEKTINIANVTELESGEQVQIVCGDVLVKNMSEAYPDESYVGKGFMIEKSDVAGKRYKAYKIAEVEI
jgi:hypothetical protein